MANIGEWQFSNTITAPPITGQIRLNNGSQTSAALIWVHKLGATGIDASGSLPTFNAGHLLRLQDKSDATKWQSYLVTGDAVAKTDYWEYPVVWQAGGSALTNGARVLFDNVGIRVPAIGKALAASVGSPSILVSKSVSVEVDAPPLRAETNAHTEVSGQLIIFDFAFPFEGKNYTSPGMTLRQYYAGRAMQGFIAGSNVPAANLVGKIAAYAFTCADSMIAFEEKERQGYHMPPAGSDRNAPATPTTPPPDEDTSVLKPPLSPTMKQVWPRKIIS